MPTPDEMATQLADPKHKTFAGLTCCCGRSFWSENARDVHRIKPWLSDSEIRSWDGNPDA